jgi:hypothetical protein
MTTDLLLKNGFTFPACRQADEGERHRRTTPPGMSSGRYKASDYLIAFLAAL